MAQALAGGAMNVSIVGNVMTVRYGDGTTAFARTLTREQLEAIATMTP